uniref:Uncharacterized protein n=1 Tax=Oryzias latipes TaxID=8090 RepID=A0A3B3HLC0_ORYLA
RQPQTSRRCSGGESTSLRTERFGEQLQWTASCPPTGVGQRPVLLQVCSGQRPVLLQVCSGQRPVLLQVCSGQRPVLLHVCSGQRPVCSGQRPVLLHVCSGQRPVLLQACSGQRLRLPLGGATANHPPPSNLVLCILHVLLHPSSLVLLLPGVSSASFLHHCSSSHRRCCELSLKLFGDVFLIWTGLTLH